MRREFTSENLSRGQSQSVPSQEMGGSLPGSADRYPYSHFLLCVISLPSVDVILTSLFLRELQGSGSPCACRSITDSTKQQGN